jgi:hypothetical protein
MNSRHLVILLLMVMFTALSANAAPSRMRPYAGIGLLILNAESNDTAKLPLYSEPGMSRSSDFAGGRIIGNDWVFGTRGVMPLVVSARKGTWLRVVYDDAGREGWLNQENSGQFVNWEAFLKQRPARLLAGLQAQYYQLLQRPAGKLSATFTARSVFKVLKVDNNWAMVVSGSSQIGWLRWVDDDGRLLVGFAVQ